MKAPLARAVRGHLERQRLTQGQWRRLQALQAAHGRRPPSPTTARRRPWLVAATIAGFAVLGFVIGLRLAGAPLDSTLVAAEVARNHAKGEAMEVTSAELSDLRRHFADLDFTLLASARMDRLQWRIEGGRHCSLGGRPAAQLRVVERATGRAQTLYQARYEPGHFPHLPRLDEGGRPLAVVVGDTPVQLWVERGILFALTDR